MTLFNRAMSEGEVPVDNTCGQRFLGGHGIQEKMGRWCLVSFEKFPDLTHSLCEFVLVHTDIDVAESMKSTCETYVDFVQPGWKPVFKSMPCSSSFNLVKRLFIVSRNVWTWPSTVAECELPFILSPRF